MPKTISIDLDGVLNTYHGNYEENKIAPIKDGAKEFLEALSKDYIIEIFTVRDKDLVSEWVKQNGIQEFITNITNIKNPYTSVFVDDRAVNFDGDYKKTLTIIKEFKPHWK